MNQREFTVIVGDLSQSRNLGNRKVFAAEIKEKLDAASILYKNNVYAPPVLTKGIDELSVVMNSPRDSYRLCRTINKAIFPEFFRFAIVSGSLDIADDSLHAGQMDGPAFHTASNLINILKKRDLPYMFSVSDDYINQVLNNLTNLVHIIRLKWTFKQNNVAIIYEKLHNQALVAKELKVSQQSISQSLSGMNWKELRNADATVDKLLEIFSENSKSGQFDKL